MATETTVTSAKAWAPDVQGQLPADIVPDALLQTIGTTVGTVEGDAPVVRVPVVFDDNAAIVPEGSAIPEADPELAEALIQTVKIAKLFRLSREQWHQDNTEAMISNAAARTMTRTADDVFLNTPAPVSPATIPPAGLLHQGIPDVGAVGANFDMLIDAFAEVETNGGTPSAIVLAPDAWANLRKLKTATGSEQSLLSVGSTDAVKMLLGTPVIVNAQMPTGTGLIVDRNDIAVATGNLQTAVSEDAYFGSDAIGLRVTWRFGASVIHPDRHATFSVTAAA